MADKYCRNCGQELRPDDHLCPGCRKSVHETDSLPISEANVPVVSPSPQNNGASTQDGQDPLGGLSHFLLSVAVPVLGAGAGLLALVGALLYVVGLVALLLPIWNIYTHNLADAWYATSLAPRTMVIGLGIGKLLTPPTLMALLITIWFLWTVMQVGFNDRQISNRTRRLVSTLLLALVFFFLNLWIGPLLFGPAPPRYTLIGAVATGIFLGLFYPVAYKRAESNRTRRLVFTLLLTLACFSMSLWIGPVWFGPAPLRYALIRAAAMGIPITVYFLALIWLVDRRHDAVGTEDAPKENAAATSTNEDNTGTIEALSLIVFLKYAGSVAGIVFLFTLLGAALPTTWAQDPPLPKAILTTKTDGIENGPLLTHTDSFWYLIDDEGQGKEELMVIPDSEVKTGRVFAD